MTDDNRAARRTHRWVRRAAALLALCTAVLHVIAVREHQTLSVLTATSMIVMATGCLYCVRHLWTRENLGDWGLVALMGIGMLVMHFSMMQGPTSNQHQQHGSGMLLTSASQNHLSPLMLASLISSAAEVTFAVFILFYRTRDSVSVTASLRLRQDRAMLTGREHKGLASQ